MGIEVAPYEAGGKGEWDEFVGGARNGVFLFRRDYMDYHADRFPDASLVFRGEGGRAVALLPATRRGDALVSHAGLTFGGIISGPGMKVGPMLELFDALAGHLRGTGVGRLVYKAVPHIYHRVPAEEDLYALFRHGARLVRRDLSSAIDARERLPFSKGRRYEAKRARREGVEVERSDDFETFMAIEEQVLGEKYDARPVHTAAELRMLAGRFPENIRLHVARRAGEVLAGVVVYESDCVAHAQYIAAGGEGKRLGALDLVLEHLINVEYAAKRYFDFGISTEEAGRRLNAGLAENKQGFGARAVVYDFYEMDLNQE
jgi:Acetyltransferase (GNAT) domain